MGDGSPGHEAIVTIGDGDQETAMMLSRRDFLYFAASAATPLAFSRSTHAQDYPSRPVTLVVPYPAGGSADAFTRIIAERMHATLGKPIVVENVTGAAGSIGTGRVARAAPDGYTFGLGNWSTHVANGAIYPLQYDVRSDFEPIAQIVFSPLMIATSKKSPPNNLTELLAWLKANSDKVSQGTNGAGSIMHLAGVLLEKETGARFNFVPYRGSAPAVQDLLSGQIDLYIGLPADLMPHARAGNIKVHAIAARDRIATALDIPTADEAGLPRFQVSAWFGFWAPKGTSGNIVAKLNAAIREALADPALRKRLQQELYLEIPRPEMQTSTALRNFQATQIEKWWPVIRAAKIKPE
jgi:tripartite-type tricarboxylate transporter receptor subunit TctC